MTTPTIRRRPSGFTLVEVLVALAIGAICVLAVAPMFVAGMKSNAIGWDYSALNSLARQRLEEILQYNFTDPRLAVAGGSTVTIDGVSQAGRLYVDQNSNTQSDGTVSISFPYTLVYIVQNYHLSDIVSAGNPAASKATTDADGTWDNTRDVKYVTVIAAASRSSLGGTAFSKTLTGAGFSGKQIRISALRAP
ncbi:MAG: type IV pilus modification PilV family protein [Thermoanaerobaculia bacterium]